jgi:hypothetical protein
MEANSGVGAAIAAGPSSRARHFAPTPELPPQTFGAMARQGILALLERDSRPCECRGAPPFPMGRPASPWLRASSHPRHGRLQVAQPDRTHVEGLRTPPAGLAGDQSTQTVCAPISGGTGALADVFARGSQATETFRRNREGNPAPKGRIVRRLGTAHLGSMF